MTVRLAAIASVEPQSEDWDTEAVIGGTQLRLLSGLKVWTPYTIHVWHDFLRTAYSDHLFAKLPELNVNGKPGPVRQPLPTAELRG